MNKNTKFFEAAEAMGVRFGDKIINVEEEQLSDVFTENLNPEEREIRKLLNECNGALVAADFVVCAIAGVICKYELPKKMLTEIMFAVDDLKKSWERTARHQEHLLKKYEQ